MALFGLVDAVADRMHVGARQRKMHDFLRLCRPAPDDIALDVGVLGKESYQAANFFLKEYPYSDNLTALAVDDLRELRGKYPAVHFVEYDGRVFPFADKSFDICHSNAVLEHVGNFERQRLFVSEMVRVARRGFFTTPNRWFPVELHTKIPLLHYLPWPMFLRVCRLLNRWDNIEGVSLMGRRKLETLVADMQFSDYEILENRVLGLTVTYSVFWRTQRMPPTTSRLR